MNGHLVPTALRGYARDAASAFRQTPLEVALGLATALFSSVAIRQDNEEAWARFVSSAALALPLLLAVSVLRARGVLSDAARWGASAAVLLAAAAHGAWIFDPEREASVWRFLALLGAVAMATSLAPVVGLEDRGSRRLAFWRFNARLLTRLVTVVAYGVALFAALAGAVAAVTALFDLNTPEEVFGDLASAVFFGLVPWVVAGGLPELLAPAERDDAPPRPVRLLGSYLYAPVLTVYLAILLAYAVKVLATGEAPKNLLSPIILLAGGFGFLGSTLLEPLRRAPEHEGVSRLIRFLPLPMLGLLPFALWAVWVRRDQYGWTEFRYLRFALLLALGVLAVVGTLRLLRRREPLLLLVPVVLGATLLLSALGPWSATAVSRRSQEARLREALAGAGVLRDGRVTMPLAPPMVAAPGSLPVPAEIHERISGSLTYLYDQHGPEAVQPLFAADVSPYENGRALLSAMRFRAGCPANQRIRFVSATLSDSMVVPAFPGGTLYRLRGSRERMQRDTTSRLRYTNDAAEIRVGEGGSVWTARADLRPLFDRLTGAGGTGCDVAGDSRSLELTATEARLPLTDSTGAVRGEMLVTEMVVREENGPSDDDPPAPLRVDHLDGLVVVRE